MASITNATLLNVHIELPEVARQGKETLSLVRDQVRLGTWLPVDARELELFTHGVVLGSAQIVGTEQITRAVIAILSDPSTRETLRQITAEASQLATVADQVAK